jgi:hypothetical protein
MPHALIEALATWPGRKATETVLDERGFSVHRAWQDRIIQFCVAETAETIHRYWNEVAQEYVTSAGKCNPDTRRFLVEPSYRSSYLDELATKVDFAEPPFRYPPLIKCIFEYNKKSYSDRAFFSNDVAAVEQYKESEFIKHAISAEGWTGLKRDVPAFAKKLAAPKGFVERRRGRFVKRSPIGLVFELKVDLGGIPQCGNGLPLLFSIYHVDDSGFVFQGVLFDKIVPGFSRYALCQSPESHVLGIAAHIELFDALFQLLPG